MDEEGLLSIMPQWTVEKKKLRNFLPQLETYVEKIILLDPPFQRLQPLRPQRDGLLHADVRPCL